MHSTMPLDQSSGFLASRLMDPAATRPWAMAENRPCLLYTSVERAYQRALEKLRSLPQEQYVELLAALLVRASSTGREEVVFSTEDREGAGKAAVARANELRCV